jgi:hypothetical protein
MTSFASAALGFARIFVIVATSVDSVTACSNMPVAVLDLMRNEQQKIL